MAACGNPRRWSRSRSRRWSWSPCDSHCCDRCALRSPSVATATSCSSTCSPPSRRAGRSAWPRPSRPTRRSSRPVPHWCCAITSFPGLKHGPTLAQPANGLPPRCAGTRWHAPRWSWRCSMPSCELRIRAWRAGWAPPPRRCPRERPSACTTTTTHCSRRSPEPCRAGAARVRLKIAPERTAAAAAVRAVHPADSLALQVDANGSFDPSDAAHRAELVELDQLELTCIEQPFPPDDLVAHADLARRFDTPRVPRRVRHLARQLRDRRLDRRV